MIDKHELKCWNDNEQLDKKKKQSCTTSSMSSQGCSMIDKHELKCWNDNEQLDKKKKKQQQSCTTSSCPPKAAT